MPSQRKRIGYLPSEEVHEIIDKLCRANEFSQSKVTGLLVEEALRSRGVLSGNFSKNNSNKSLALKGANDLNKITTINYLANDFPVEPKSVKASSNLSIILSSAFLNTFLGSYCFL